MKLAKVYIKEEKFKALLNRHLWIFSGAISKQDPVVDGDIVELYLTNGQLVGYGFYVDGPSIKVKMFEHTNTQIDVLSYNYWNNKIRNAYELRKNIFRYTNAYRLIYAEGDFIPGLIIDVYDKVAVIQIYHSGIDRVFEFIVQSLNNLGFKYIYVKKTFHNSTLATGWIKEKADTQIVIQEYGIKFLVDIEHGQKTGFYIDQRDNRALIERYATDRRVLNLFSYTGGFSLYALRSGATTVHSVDQSKKALELAQKNVELNDFDQSLHQTFAEDCFSFMEQSPEYFYDLIIVDPPAFAKSEQSIANAVRGYKEINKKVLHKIKSGGIVFTFSCSQRIEQQLFRKTIFSAAAEVGRNTRIIHELRQGTDHPINIFHPETEYLKGLVLYVE